MPHRAWTSLLVVAFASGLPRHPINQLGSKHLEEHPVYPLDALESLDALEAEIAGVLQPQLERTHLLNHAHALDGERRTDCFDCELPASGAGLMKVGRMYDMGVLSPAVLLGLPILEAHPTLQGLSRMLQHDRKLTLRGWAFLHYDSTEEAPPYVCVVPEPSEAGSISEQTLACPAHAEYVEAPCPAPRRWAKYWTRRRGCGTANTKRTRRCELLEDGLEEADGIIDIHRSSGATGSVDLRLWGGKCFLAHRDKPRGLVLVTGLKLDTHYIATFGSSREAAAARAARVLFAAGGEEGWLSGDDADGGRKQWYKEQIEAGATGYAPMKSQVACPAGFGYADTSLDECGRPKDLSLNKAHLMECGLFGLLATAHPDDTARLEEDGAAVPGSGFTAHAFMLNAMGGAWATAKKFFGVRDLHTTQQGRLPMGRRLVAEAFAAFPGLVRYIAAVPSRAELYAAEMGRAANAAPATPPESSDVAAQAIMRVLAAARTFEVNAIMAMVLSSDDQIGATLDLDSLLERPEWPGGEGGYLPKFGSSGSNDPTSDDDQNLKGRRTQLVTARYNEIYVAANQLEPRDKWDNVVYAQDYMPEHQKDETEQLLLMYPKKDHAIMGVFAFMKLVVWDFGGVPGDFALVDSLVDKVVHKMVGYADMDLGENEAPRPPATCGAEETPVLKAVAARAKSLALKWRSLKVACAAGHQPAWPAELVASANAAQAAHVAHEYMHDFQDNFASNRVYEGLLAAQLEYEERVLHDAKKNPEAEASYAPGPVSPGQMAAPYRGSCAETRMADATLHDGDSMEAAQVRGDCDPSGFWSKLTGWAAAFSNEPYFARGSVLQMGIVQMKRAWEFSYMQQPELALQAFTENLGDVLKELKHAGLTTAGKTAGAYHMLTEVSKYAHRLGQAGVMLALWLEPRLAAPQGEDHPCVATGAPQADHPLGTFAGEGKVEALCTAFALCLTLAHPSYDEAFNKDIRKGGGWSDALTQAGRGAELLLPLGHETAWAAVEPKRRRFYKRGHPADADKPGKPAAEPLLEPLAMWAMAQPITRLVEGGLLDDTRFLDTLFDGWSSLQALVRLAIEQDVAGRANTGECETLAEFETSSWGHGTAATGWVVAANAERVALGLEPDLLSAAALRCVTTPPEVPAHRELWCSVAAHPGGGHEGPLEPTDARIFDGADAVVTPHHGLCVTAPETPEPPVVNAEKDTATT